MFKTDLSPHNGIFYDTREFLGAVLAGQIDRKCLAFMDSLTDSYVNPPMLGRPDVESCSDLEVAASIALSCQSDKELQDLFDEAVEKMEAEQEGKKDPRFLVVMTYKGQHKSYLTKDGELYGDMQDPELNKFTFEEIQRIWPTLILEQLEKLEIVPVSEQGER